MNRAHRPQPRLPHTLRLPRLPRLPRLLLASAFMLSALGAAPALAEPAPAPAPRALQDPLHPCTVLLCLPEPGKAVQSPTSAAPPAAQSAAPGAEANSAAARPAACAATAQAPLSVASDPEEGGQVARTAAHKPKVGEINVTKSTDKASTTLMERSVPAGSCP